MSGTEREPCPWRIVDDAGGAFAFGIVGGGIWHGFGGLRNAPRGQRFSQAISRVKSRAPILGGSFAVWGTFFSIFDCSIAHARQKEDPWNAIASGFLTGGVLAIRAGPRVAAQNALAGGVILAMIEGLNISIQRVLMPWLEKRQMEAEGTIKIDTLEPPNDPLRPRSKSLWQPSKPLPAGMGGSSSGGGVGSGGFDLDKVYDFEKRNGAEGFGNDIGSSSSFNSEVTSDSSGNSDGESKPWYKVW